MKNIFPIFADGLSIDVNQILTILNYVWIGALIFVLVVLVLCFIRGFFRGWRYGTYRLIFMGLLIAGSLIAIHFLTELVEVVDLRSFNVPDVTVPINDSEVVIHWTTPIVSLSNFFYDAMRVLGVNGDASALLDYAIALAISTIKLVLLVVFAIIIATVGYFLCWFFWFLIFKRFTPKAKRKIKKLRIVSALEELLLGGALLAMFLSPLTGFVNMLSNHLKMDPDEAKKQETVSMVYTVLDSYTNSIFSKVFFSWTVFDGKDSLDTRLIDFVSTTKINDVETSLISELTAVADIGSTIINSGLLSYFGSEGIRWGILNSTLVPDLLDQILQTDLIRIALPVAINLAVNMDAVKDVLGESTVEWLATTTVDWTSEIGNIGTLYRKMVDANVFDCVLDEVSQTPVFDFRQVYNMFVGSNAAATYQAFHEGVDAIDTEVLNHLVAGLITSLAVNSGETKDDDPATLQLFDFLPLGEDGMPIYEEVASMKWANELSIIYDTLYSLVNIDPTETKDIFFSLPERTQMGKKMAKIEGEEDNPGSDIFNDAVREKLIAFLIDHASEVKDCLVGQVDESGEPINIDPATGISTGPKNLLDSILIGNALPSMVPFLGSTLTETMNMGEFNLDGPQAALTSGVVRTNFKREFSAVLGVVTRVTSHPAGKAFLRNPTGMEGMYFDPDGTLYEIDPELVEALCRGLRSIDKSLLLSEIIPTVAENSLTNLVDLSSMGISELDFRCENLGQELSDLLYIAVDCPNVIHDFAHVDFASDFTSMFDILEADQDEMVRLLDHFIDSKILNPDKIVGGHVVHNDNFCGMLNNIFTNISDDFEPITPEDLPANLTRTYDEDGNILTRGETDAVVTALVDIVSSGIINDLSSLGSSSSADAISVLQKLDFERVFTDIGNSVILRKVAGAAFDTYLDPVLDAASIGLGEQVSFRNIVTAEDWANEGAAMASIIDLATNGIDLSSFDFFNDAPTLIPLLKALARSGIFVHEGDYYFPHYMYNKLLQNMGSWDTLKYFADDCDLVDPNISTLDAKRALTTQLYEDMVEGLPTRENWVGDGEELDRMKAALGDIGKLGGIDGLSTFDAETLPILEQALLDIADSKALGGVVLYNGLHTAIANLPTGSGDDTIDFSVANVDYLKPSSGHSQLERKNEIRNLVSALDVIYDPAYGIIDEEGNMGFASMNLTALSVDFFLKPLLQGFHESHILFECSDSAPSGSLSVFEQMMSMFMRKSNVYDDCINTPDIVTGEHPLDDTGHTDATVESVILAVPEAEWDDEIDAICGLIDLLQHSSFVDGSGAISFSELENPTDFFGRDETSRNAHKTELYGILSSLNSSRLFYRALAFRLDAVFHSATDMVGTFDSGFLDYADPYFTTTGTDYLPYSDGEVARLVDIMGDMSRLSTVSVTDINTIDADALSEILVEMSECGIFNATARHDDVYNKDFTYFQELMMKVIGVDLMSEYLYRDTSPKDIANAAYYTDFHTKVAYIVEQRFATRYDGDLTAQKALIESEAGSIRAVLKTLTSPALSSLVGSATLDFASVSPGVLSTILHTFNSCSIYQDCVPNALAKMAGDGTFTISGIDLSRANFYYCYWVNNDGSFRPLADPNYEKPYDSTEIDQVSSLFYTIRKMKDKIGSTFNIGSIDAIGLRNLLLDLYNSIVFHNEGVMDPYTQSSIVAAYLDGDDLVFNDLTVFEQLMYMVYDKSGLGNRAYAEAYDRDLFATYGANGYKFKLHNSIMVGPSDWSEEIDNFTCDGIHDDIGLINILQNSGMISGSEATLDANALKSLQPEVLTDLLRSLNLCEVVRDSLPYTLKSLFAATGDGISLDTYSTIDVPLGTNGTTLETVLIDVGDSGALPYVRKVKITYASEPTLTVFADMDDDPLTFEADVTAKAKINTSGSTKEIILDDIPYRTKIVSDADVTFVDYGYDVASYRFSKAEFENNDRHVLLDLLDSLYDDVGGSYYTFQGAGDDVLTSFLQDGYSTNGILEFFRDDSIYSTNLALDGVFSDYYLPVASAQPVTASEFAIYKIMSIQPTLALPGLANTAVNLCDNIRDEAGLSYGNVRYEKLANLSELWRDASFEINQEASWFDHNIVNAVVLHVYNSYLPTAVTNRTANVTIHGLIAGQYEKAVSVATSLVNPLYPIDNPTLSGEIMAGLTQGFYAAQKSLATNIADGTLSSSMLNGETANRLELIRSDDVPDTYASSYALIRDDSATGLPATLATHWTLINDVVEKASHSTAIPDSSKNALALLDSVPASLNGAVDLFYVGTLYDLLLTAQYFAATASVPSYLTDLPRPNVDGGNNYIHGEINTLSMTAEPADIAALGGFYHAVASLL